MTSMFRAHQFVTGDFKPKHVAIMEPTPKRIRVLFGGEAIADSKQVLVMHETNHVPVYYFPMTDVRMDLLEPTGHSTH